MPLRHARAGTSVSARNEYRLHLFNLSFLLLLGAAALWATQGTTARPVAGVRLVTAALKAVAPKPPQTQPETKVVTPAPSAFAIESAMASSDLIKRWSPIITEASKKFGVSETWIRAVMRMESGGRTMLGENQPIISSAGAMGLMQLMPETYADMRAQNGLGADIFNPRDNIFAGAAYLRILYRKYGNPAMFAAYNDGPGALEDHLYRGRPLPAETQAYVSGIASLTGAKTEVVASSGKLVELTRPDGSRVAIDPARVRYIRAVTQGEYADGVQSVVLVGKKLQGVRETVREATVAVGLS
jgi:soluble lytic murein transglycosylase-like protein